MDPLFTLAGLIVGICVGLTGVGGGALMTPILMLGFGIPAAIAVGTDLAYAAITKGSGLWFHARKRVVRWDLVARLALGSLPAAVITIWVLSDLRNSPHLEEMITTALGIALVVTSLALLLKERIQLRISNSNSNHDLAGWLNQHRDLLLTLLGAVLGVLVTLSSVGAGALTAAALFLLYPRLPAISVVGTDLAHALPLAVIASLGHWQLGTIDFSLLGSLLLGSIPGTALGSQLALHLSENILRRGLAGLLLITGLKFVL